MAALCHRCGTVVAAIVGREGAYRHSNRLAALYDLFFANVVEVFAEEGNALADGDAVEGGIGDEVAATAVVEGAGGSEEEGRIR